MKPDNYDVLVMQLSEDEGGGYVALVPDLVGCMSDGDTQEEAIANVRDAIQAWCEAEMAEGRECPKPGTARAAALEQEKEVLTSLRQQQELIEKLSTRIHELESSGGRRIAAATTWSMSYSYKPVQRLGTGRKTRAPQAH